MAKIDANSLLEKLKQEQKALDEHFSAKKSQVEASVESLEFADEILALALAAIQSGNDLETVRTLLKESRKQIRDRDKALSQSLSSLIAKYQTLESVIKTVEGMDTQEESVSRVMERLEANDITEGRPRKIGERPESIKNIRTAKKRLAESDSENQEE